MSGLILEPFRVNFGGRQGKFWGHRGFFSFGGGREGPMGQHMKGIPEENDAADETAATDDGTSGAKCVFPRSSHPQKRQCF